MPLCGVCDALDLDQKETCLGPYDGLLAKADDGCEACLFFCDILLQSSREENYEKGGPVAIGRSGPFTAGKRTDTQYIAPAPPGPCGMPLNYMVFFNSLRLDCRNPNSIEISSWGVDALLFDQCKRENSKGELCPRLLVADRLVPDEFGSELYDPAIDFRRSIPEDAASADCASLIESWLAKCSQHACKKQTDVLLPTRVIEIPFDTSIPPRLCSSRGRKGRYVALSHCWGGAEMVKLTTKQLANFNTALDVDSLPRSLQDALTLTRSLGFKYLWIDALCIIQDDEADWLAESPKMTTVYGEATLVISATAAKGSDSGILTKRRVLYSPVLGLAKSRHLRQRLLRGMWDVDNSPLSTRGWGLQERVLAPRIVHFTKRQMIWECAETKYFEASVISDEHISSENSRMGYNKATAQDLINRALRKGQHAGETLGIDSDDIKFSARLEAWCQCVDEFSGRSLTFSSDKLPAVAGLAAAFDDGTMGDYLAGIWTRHIGFNLAWSRVFQLLTKPDAYRAPSWSWASVDGATSFIRTADSPQTQLKDQASNSASMDFYGPKLFEQHMVLKDPSNVYMGVLEGSYIVVNASYKNFTDFCNHFRDEGVVEIHMNVVLDSSDGFDCHCCRPAKVSVILDPLMS